MLLIPKSHKYNYSPEYKQEIHGNIQNYLEIKILHLMIEMYMESRHSRVSI